MEYNEITVFVDKSLAEDRIMKRQILEINVDGSNLHAIWARISTGRPSQETFTKTITFETPENAQDGAEYIKSGCSNMDVRPQPITPQSMPFAW